MREVKTEMKTLRADGVLVVRDISRVRLNSHERKVFRVFEQVGKDLFYRGSFSAPVDVPNFRLLEWADVEGNQEWDDVD